MKDFLDKIFGITLFVILLPIYIIIIFLLRIFTTESIIYSHFRVGENGKKFKLYKFRTMSSDASVLSDYFKKYPEKQKIWKEKQKLIYDPRITKIGYYLREFSLDELPQILNIIKGEMSFIGPRPIVEEEILKYGESFNIYKKVKPGLSGLWQVSGRNNMTYDERIACDIEYVENKSLFLDIKIFIKTFYAVWSRKGAY